MHHELTHPPIPAHPPIGPPAHHDAPDAKATRRTARRATAIIEANPDLTVADIAHQYALADQPGHPDPDVLALLVFLAQQTLGVEVARRPEVV
jgi:hypothetical protein